MDFSNCGMAWTCQIMAGHQLVKEWHAWTCQIVAGHKLVKQWHVLACQTSSIGLQRRKQISLMISNSGSLFCTRLQQQHKPGSTQQRCRGHNIIRTKGQVFSALLVCLCERRAQCTRSNAKTYMQHSKQQTASKHTPAGRVHKKACSAYPLLSPSSLLLSIAV